MALWTYTPLAVAFLVVVTLSAGLLSRRVATITSRLARLLVGRFVTDSRERRRTLQAAYTETTYRTYAARTLLYTVVAGFVGGITGVYLVTGTLVVLPAVMATLAQLPSVMGQVLGNRDLVIELSTAEWALLHVGGGLAVGGGAAVLTYLLRWSIPRSDAEVRRRGINEALPRTVAFIYALSRGGTDFPTVMRTLGHNQSVYGDAAAEVNVGVREMDLFNTDMITAIRRVAYRTPSERWKTFSENLASILQSGQSLPRFLESQYERYQARAEERQEEVLELLATIAEAYVTTLVAGSLFLITILLVFGLTTTDTLLFIQLLVYAIIPLTSAGFVVVLSGKLEQLGIARESGVSELEPKTDLSSAAPDTPSREATRPPLEGTDGGTTSTDGGATPEIRANRIQLALYDRFEQVKRLAGNPIQSIFWRPTLLVYLTVPLAVAWVVVHLPTVFGTGQFNVRLFDDVLIQAMLFVLGTFAVVRQVYKRRVDRIESATPELLERLASLNEAGMSVVESLERVRDSDLGALSDEVERIWTDVSLGANVNEGLVRFGRRVRTTSIARVVTLLTNAMHASGELGPVLRIASEQSRADLRLRRKRRQQMFTYLVVIYISFVVFLVIIVAVKEVLVPALPTDVPTPPSRNRLGVNVGQFARLGKVDKAAYTLVFFHAALIQGVCSGFIAGQLGEGTLKDGAKHAAVMLAVAYAAFVVLSSPVASMDFPDQTTDGETITLESVSLSEGGFVVVHERSRAGPVIGRSAYLPAGTHGQVVVTLDRPPSNKNLVAVPHLDTDGDEQYTVAGGEVDPPYPDVGYQVVVPGEVTSQSSEGEDSGGSSVDPPPANRPTLSVPRSARPG